MFISAWPQSHPVLSEDEAYNRPRVPMLCLFTIFLNTSSYMRSRRLAGYIFHPLTLRIMADETTYLTSEFNCLHIRCNANILILMLILEKKTALIPEIMPVQNCNIMLHHTLFPCLLTNVYLERQEIWFCLLSYIIT